MSRHHGVLGEMISSDSWNSLAGCIPYIPGSFVLLMTRLQEFHQFFTATGYFSSEDKISLSVSVSAAFSLYQCVFSHEIVLLKSLFKSLN